MSDRNFYKGGTEVRESKVFDEAQKLPRKPHKREKPMSAHERRLVQAMEQAQQQGYQRGYAEGLSRAEKEAAGRLEKQIAQEVAAFRDSLESSVSHVLSSVDSWYVEAEERIAKLALEVARRALVELDASHESIVPIAKQALLEIRDSTQVRIRTNPAAASVLDSRKEEILQAVAGISGLEIVRDSTISGGCIVESEEGLLDARVDTYLRRIAEEAA